MLSMRITEGARGQLSGAGTIRDARDSTTVPFSASVSYTRPDFTLSIDAFAWKGRQVRGTFRSRYTSFMGMSGELVLEGLAGAPFVERFPLLLQEQ